MKRAHEAGRRAWPFPLVIRRFLLILTLFHLTSQARAEVPGIINYQGRVVVNGTNFTGNGQFRFALVDGGDVLARRATAVAHRTGPVVTSFTVTDPGAGYVTVPNVSISGGGGAGATAHAVISGGVVTSVGIDQGGGGYASDPTVSIDSPPPNYRTLWSNGSGAVSVSVSKGLYSVPIGDTTIPGVETPVPAVVFTNSDVRLRVWFDGGNGMQQLSPDQRIAVVGYAFMAASVRDGAVTAASIAPGAVGTQHLASGSVAASQLAPDIGVWAKNGTAISYSSGNVGIGTASPQAGLHIASGPQWSSHNLGANILVDGTRNNAIGFLDSTSGKPWAMFNGAGQFRMAQMPPLGDIGTAPEYRFAISTNGSVGIGTLTPTHELTVQAPSGSDVISFRNPSYELGRLGIGAHADGGSLWLKSDGAWKVAINADDVSYFNGGNVGIGTVTPAEKLEVAGRILLNGPEGNLHGVDLSSLANSGKLLIGWNQSGGGGEADFIANRGSGDVGGFSFFDMDNSGTLRQLMTMKGNGRVGIGTYSPAEQLDVAGAVKIGTTTNPTPAAGTIRWTGTDFQGYDGTRWVSLRSGATFGNMVLVPGGTFTMGSAAVERADALPEHQVTLSSFYISKYEVSYALWYTNKVRATTSYGYNFQNAGREGDDGTAGAAPTAADSEPVTCVNWRDAIVWCNARSEIEGLTPVYTYGGAVIRDSRDANSNACDNAMFNTGNSGYRLPTEAQWEYAARYVDGWSWTPGDFPSGAGFNYLNAPACAEVAWYAGNSSNDTHVVGTKKANQLGLHDMSGNVAEWCWDWYSSTYYGSSPGTDPQGSSTGSDRVFRGGSWDYYAYFCRVAIRDYLYPAYGGYYIGFRVVLPPGQ